MASDLTKWSDRRYHEFSPSRRRAVFRSFIFMYSISGRDANRFEMGGTPQQQTDILTQSNRPDPRMRADCLCEFDSLHSQLRRPNEYRTLYILAKQTHHWGTEWRRYYYFMFIATTATARWRRVAKQMTWSELRRRKKHVQWNATRHSIEDALVPAVFIQK